MQNQDINQQINRILSSNIRDELLSNIPIEFLQSPCVQKAQKINERSSSINRSFSRQDFEEDLFQKAQQIFKLKQTLESELANINQIVQDNQKLTEANLYLNSELKKIKAEWSNFRGEAIRELKVKKQEIRQFQALAEEALHKFSQKSLRKLSKMKVCTVDSIEIISRQVQNLTRPPKISFKIDSEVFRKTILPMRKAQEDQLRQKITTAPQIEATSQQINALKTKVKILNDENISLKKEIQSLRSNENKNSLINSSALQQNQAIPQQVQCYSSVFMKSIFSEVENTDDIIRAVLFNQQKSIFEQLEESKYFGKIVLGKKNGNALEQYKNDFHYEGSFSRNHRHGIGKLFYKDKIVYAGQWKAGKFQGKGVLYYSLNLNVQKIQGNFKNCCLEGNATITFKSGDKLRAHFRNNEIQSEGMMITCESNNAQFFSRNSYLGQIQALTDKQQGNAKISFKTQQGKVLQVC